MKTLIFCLLLSAFSFADPSSYPEDASNHIVIQNRILAKVGDKTLSVLDVVKKMEVVLSRYYPQYANSNEAKQHYFASQWKETLQQMIDHELILEDAGKLELKVTDAEVRETLMERFGPNLMASLDKLGLSYEEAREMIHSELIVQKMTWFKVHAKALNAVNTQDIKKAYTRYCEKNPAKEQWSYKVLSIKAKDEEIAKQLAQKAYDLCHETPSKLSDMPQTLKEVLSPDAEDPSLSISLSEDLTAEDKQLSSIHKQALLSLVTHSISAPIKQISRSGQSAVYRIFFLQNHTKTDVPSLRVLYDKLHDQLVQEAANRESQAYISKLRERYGFDLKTLEESLPSGFQPFSLQQ